MANNLDRSAVFCRDKGIQTVGGSVKALLTSFSSLGITLISFKHDVMFGMYPWRSGTSIKRPGSDIGLSDSFVNSVIDEVIAGSEL